ncbi:hypothetical protein KPH14_012837 [Odynerus spinipes]|uniref:Integrase catalytic domain-containing protein n=1 Tax=Odynerus spinipes TaxID=1348599 RepID=A0AAD9VL49_9HYME|nr:hypothetical protein KPH14_012837 [Odynerus spinipes]
MTTRTPPEEQNHLLDQQQLLQILADLQDQLHCLQQEQPVQQVPQVPEINHNPPIMQNEIAAVVSYKLPNFWKSKPDLWFTQIEAGFRRRRIINDRAKFDAVLEALDETSIAEVSDIIMRPPEDQPYERLRENLIKRFTDSSERQLHRLLAEIELGDKKPSQLLRQMKDLAQNKVSDELLKTRWLNLLPKNVCNILRVCTEDNLSKLADIADTILENNSDSTVMAVNLANKRFNAVDDKRSVAEKFETRLSSLEKSVTEMIVQMKKIAVNFEQNNRRSRSRSRSRSRPASGSIVSVIPKTCVKEKLKATAFKLYAANSTVITTYGQRHVTLSLGLRRAFTWNFIIADVASAIIGADFITYYGLLIDLKARRLIDPQTTLTSSGKLVSTEIYSISTVNLQSTDSGTKPEYLQLIKEYVDITRPLSKFGPPPDKEIAHYIPTTGPQFESSLFRGLVRFIGANKTRTTPYHPESNGIIERWHRTLKTALMCKPQIPWLDLLPSVLLGLRTSYKEDLKSSPAEMLYSTTLRVPGEFFVHQDAPADPQEFIEKHRTLMRNIQPTGTSNHSKTKLFLMKDMNTCTHVFIRSDHVRTPLEAPYMGPFKIIERVNERVFKIDINGQEKNISVERLKPAHMASEQIDDVQSITENEEFERKPKKKHHVQFQIHLSSTRKALGRE